jgi:hypothetical protein
VTIAGKRVKTTTDRFRFGADAEDSERRVHYEELETVESVRSCLEENFGILREETIHLNLDASDAADAAVWGHL